MGTALMDLTFLATSGPIKSNIFICSQNYFCHLNFERPNPEVTESISGLFLISAIADTLCHLMSRRELTVDPLDRRLDVVRKFVDSVCQ